MSEDKVATDADSLNSLCLAVLTSAGLTAEAAALAANVLVRSTLRGVESHGINALAQYTKQVKQGGANPAAVPELVTDRGALIVIDAQAGLGPAVASSATSLAIERARQFGTATVAVRNANHFGAAGHFALMCAEANCIGLVASNTPPIMAVTGSSVRSIGNSPLAFGAPRLGGSPFVLDVAMSRVAGGKIRLALARGEQVPLGWILDPEGNPTTEPADFFERYGALLPIENHKGYGLALMVETLAGALSGSAMLGGVQNWLYSPETPSNTGYFLQVIDVSADGAFPDFAGRMKQLCDQVTASPRAPGVDRILIPGDLEAEREAQAQEHGVELSVELWTILQGLADEAGYTLVGTAAK
jgi:LDH2 family malate/lactate/ureidoglycolate dehydrogenase